MNLQSARRDTEHVVPSPVEPGRRFVGIVWLASGWSVMLAALSAYSAISPTGLTWGMHHPGFLPLSWRVALLVPVVLVLVPPIRSWLIEMISRVCSYVSTRPKIIQIVLAGIVLTGIALLFWQGRERYSLLGDGALLVRSITNIEAGESLPNSSSRNEPLSAWVIVSFHRLLSAGGISAASEEVFQYLSIACGLVWFVLLYLLVRLFVESPVDRMLVYVFIAVSGFIQMFIGYAENYAPVMVGLLLFVLASLAYLKGRVPVAIVGTACGVLVALHFAMIALLPGLGYLLLLEIRKKNYFAAGFAVAAFVVTAYCLLWTCGYTPGLLVEHFRSNDGHLLPLWTGADPQHAYTLTSMYHLLDVANLYLLVSPFALPLVILFMIRSVPKGFPNTIWMYLRVLAFSGFAFTFIVHCALGMSRDWDLLAPFTIGLIIAAAFACHYFVEDQSVRRNLLLLMSIVTAMHTLAWVAVNASDEGSLARFRVLPDRRLWGKQAVLSSYDEIGAHYRQHSDFDQAIEYYRAYLAIDSMNGRILGNVGLSYMGKHDSALAVDYFKRGIQNGSNVAEVYYRLATVYMETDTGQAIALIERAFMLDPNSEDILLNYGTILIKARRAYAQALECFQRAIAINPSFAAAHRNAGFCLINLGELDEGKKYLSKFLELQPEDPDAPRIRRIIEQTN